MRTRVYHHDSPWHPYVIEVIYLLVFVLLGIVLVGKQLVVHVGNPHDNLLPYNTIPTHVPPLCLHPMSFNDGIIIYQVNHHRYF